MKKLQLNKEEYAELYLDTLKLNGAEINHLLEPVGSHKVWWAVNSDGKIVTVSEESFIGHKSGEKLWEVTYCIGSAIKHSIVEDAIDNSVGQPL